jgi:hypothetical protein
MSARGMRRSAGAAVVASSLLAAAASVSPAVADHAREQARTAGSAATVQAMVVGQGGRAGSRTCSVAAGTPLSVLAGLGLSFSVRDYGHCGSSPRNSGELFVDELAGERNSGADGWEYKVGEVAGSTGAASTSGPLGNGRMISSGQRVLWFWCQSRGGGCQRTLEVVGPGSVSRGGRLSVRVTGYENEGHGAPVAGAVVTLGADFATTGAGGTATLIAPSSSGRYQLSARRSGLVPSFPVTVQVR